MASSDFDARTAAFLGWFKSLPGAMFSDALSIVDLRARGAGRGIIASKDIEPDTTLFTIPRKAIINIETSDIAPKLPGVFDLDSQPADEDAEGPRQDSWSSLILIMMYEFLREDESRWKPYFDVLPVRFETPMFWSDGELSELQASSLVSKIGKADAENMFRANILPVIRQNPQLFSASGDKNDGELISLAHRMGSTIMAYAFDLENDNDQEEDEADGWVEDRDGKSMMGMVPMADILNADAEFNAHVNHGEDNLTVVSLRPIKAGEEILNYYGPHPNSELLRRYGYVTEKHSRHDVLEIPWDVVEAALRAELGTSDETLKKISAKIEDDDVVEDTFVLERETGAPKSDGTFGEPSPAVAMPEDLMEQLEVFVKGIKKLEPGSLPEKRKREDVIQAVLMRSLLAIESRYPTTAAEDERLLQRSPLSDRQRMAIVVRLGEKRLLQETKTVLSGDTEDEMDVDAPEPNKRTRTSA